MKFEPHHRQYDILLVEDNPGDVRLIQEALEDSHGLKLHVARDGVEALELFYGEGQEENQPSPAIIILDLNLPRKDGREVLEKLKSDPSKRMIPVIVFTTSNAQSDILKTYSLHANCYITKPTGLQQFIEVIQNIAAFWLGIVELPVDTR